MVFSSHLSVFYFLPLVLLGRDVEVVDLLRPFQAARDGYRLGLKRDDHWNDVQIELAASVVAARLRRYGFVQAAAGQAKRYTTRPSKISGDRGVSTMRQVVTPSGELYDDVEKSPVLVVGDSNLHIYQYRTENLSATGLFEGRRVVVFVGATWVLSAMPWLVVDE